MMDSDERSDEDREPKTEPDSTLILTTLPQFSFFSFFLFQVNLYKECPFWNGAGLCMNRDCSVETMDKSKIPEKWKSHNLGKVSMLSSLNQVRLAYLIPNVVSVCATLSLLISLMFIFCK